MDLRQTQSLPHFLRGFFTFNTVNGDEVFFKMKYHIKAQLCHSSIKHCCLPQLKTTFPGNTHPVCDWSYLVLETLAQRSFDLLKELFVDRRKQKTALKSIWSADFIALFSCSFSQKILAAFLTCHLSCIRKERTQLCYSTALTYKKFSGPSIPFLGKKNNKVTQKKLLIILWYLLYYCIYYYIIIT